MDPEFGRQMMHRPSGNIRIDHRGGPLSDRDQLADVMSGGAGKRMARHSPRGGTFFFSRRPKGEVRRRRPQNLVRQLERQDPGCGGYWWPCHRHVGPTAAQALPPTSAACRPSEMETQDESVDGGAPDRRVHPKSSMALSRSGTTRSSTVGQQPGSAWRTRCRKDPKATRICLD